ncbi:MAG TPA: hypothetical protein VK797_21065 [Tepidisphaeraceae bacterium]|jgi:hypothetical protein|nr:hypothetical protein [Tepidisphaeraceae bacterium]
MKERTIRELGGEIFAELFVRQRDSKEPLAQLDWRLAQDLITS